MEKNIRNTLHLNTLKFQFPGHFNFFLIYIYNCYAAPARIFIFGWSEIYVKNGKPRVIRLRWGELCP